MTKKPDTTTLIATAAVTFAAAATTYMFFKAYKTIQQLKDLEFVELDFGNDEGILSMFKREDTK
jgi:hypothetical protein